MKTRNIFFLIISIALITQFCEKIERITMIKIGDAENERSQTVTVNAEIVDLNESETFLSYGFCWSKGENPTIDDLSLSHQGNPQKGNYKEELSGLTPDTKYYFRAYILTSTDTLYTQQNFFRTQQGQVTSLPVETYEISNYTENSVTLQVNIVLNDGDTLTEKGLVWGTEPNPTKSDNLRLDETDGTAINLEITDLESNATVYIRAFAEINGEIIYTTEKQVTTQATVEPGEITITTTDIIDTTATSAKCGGEIISDGDQVILKKGVCWSLLINPTLDDNIVEYTGTEDEFTAEISALQPSTIYHVRAFAYSASDTSYGADKVFTTLDEEPENPVDTISVQKGIITFEATNIGADSATIGGYVSESLANVTEKGLCISTVPGACEVKKATTESDNIFYINTSNLIPSTTYYIRTYADMNGETKYGNEVEFTTQEPYLNVYTKNVTHINENSAKGGGYFESGGSFDITEKGICFSTEENADLTNKVVGGSGSEEYNVDITGLDLNVTYYMRAYAICNGETYFGNEFEIQTDKADEEIITIDIINISDRSATALGKINTTDNTINGYCFANSYVNTIPTISYCANKAEADENGNYQMELSLWYNKIYYIRAFLYRNNEPKKINGEIFAILTKPGYPIIEILDIKDITTNSINFTIDYSKTDKAIKIAEYYIHLDTIPMDIESTPSSTGTSSTFEDVMTMEIDELIPGTTYYIGAAANSSGGAGWGFSKQYSFTTPTE